MAGKRLAQNNTPITSPTDYKERMIKENAEKAQRAKIDKLQNRVSELEAAELAWAKEKLDLESDAGALRLHVDLLQVEKKDLVDTVAHLEKEKVNMEKKIKTVGAEKPLEDPIEDKDLTLTKKPAQARQMPKKEAKPEAKEKKAEEEEL